MSRTKTTAEQGGKLTLKLYCGATSGIKWKTSDKSIVKIVSKSKNQVTLKAVKPGKAVITATYKSKTYKCVVTVKKKAQPSVTPTPTIAPKPEPTTIPYDTGNAKEILLPPIP